MENNNNNKIDFSELTEYLGNNFTKIDERFTKINEDFLKIDNRFTRIEDILETKADKSDVNNLLTAVDAYAKKADDYFQEMVMLAHKVDNLEKWIHQIADKVGLKLEY
jgi:hypothetical protein